MDVTGTYSSLAKIYDANIEVDYEAWARYLLSLSLRHGHLPQRILDLGCGTGNLTILLAKRGYELTAIDLSPEMLQIAEAKGVREGLEIPFTVQDIRELNLPQTDYDTVLSVCDVLNYLTRLDELQRVFTKVAQHLAPGGFWFFDLNSASKLKNIYGNNSYADLQEDVAYFWDNQYCSTRQICRMELTFFTKNPQGYYVKSKEIHLQKLWRPPVIELLAKKAGFEVLGCYDFLTEKPWSEQSERWQFVVRKKLANSTKKKH